MKLKEYLLADLFDISTARSIDKNKIEMDNDGIYDFIGRTSMNYGIQGRVNKLDYAPNPRNRFSLVQIGETIALWRENEWYASQNIFLLNPKFNEIKNVFLYFQTVINKKMGIYGKNYNSYPTMAALKNTTITLPVTEQGEIDWRYMEERIAELEKERIAELEQYLIATGLNDYELTDKDREILSLSGIRSDKESDSKDAVRIYKEFKVSDLFTSENGDIDLQKKDINDVGIDVISSGITNNGFIGKTARPAKVFAGNSLTIDMFGYVFYRNLSYKMVTHARVFALLPKFPMNDVLGQYFVSCFSHLPNKYNYSNMCSWNKIKDDFIQLPIQTATNNVPILDTDCKYHPNGYIPDWEFMEKYIRAIEKIVIADVVKYKDEMIAKTKEITT